MTYMLLFLILLFLFGKIQGFTDMIQVFRPTGERSSISFLADDLPKDCVVSLLFDSNITIGTCYCDEDPKLMKDFTGKVELSCPASLIFPCPQKSDCGVYSARVTGDQSKIVKYNVTFQDPVSPVELKVILNSSCDLKVTCTTEDVEISGTLKCDDKSCHLVGGERSKVTKSGASLRLYQSNESIICNHSNQVNWTQDKKEIQPYFRSEGCTDQTTLPVVIGVTAAAIIVVAAIIFVAVLCCCLKKAENLQMLPQTPEVNGDPGSDRLMEENTV